MAKADKERKSAKVTLAGTEKQAEDQRQKLHKIEDQLAIAKEKIEAQKKELEKVEEAVAQAE